MSICCQNFKCEDRPESFSVFNPQFGAFQDEYEEGEYYEEDDGDITGDEKGSQLLLVRSHFWASHDGTLVRHNLCALSYFIPFCLSQRRRQN